MRPHNNNLREPKAIPLEHAYPRHPQHTANDSGIPNHKLLNWLGVRGMFQGYVGKVLSAIQGFNVNAAYGRSHPLTSSQLFVFIVTSEANLTFKTYKLSQERRALGWLIFIARMIQYYNIPFFEGLYILV